MLESHMLTTGSLINIDVRDIQKAEEFYCGVFGLRVVRRFGSDGVELSGLGVPCFLLQKAEGSGAVPNGTGQRIYSRHWTPVHLDITVTDIEAMQKRALAAGAQAESDIRTVPYGKIALMADPFGHGFCLIEFNEKGYDALAN
jgi:predicted enzyme related to lactoylglutathione lyase